MKNIGVKFFSGVESTFLFHLWVMNISVQILVSLLHSAEDSPYGDVIRLEDDTCKLYHGPYFDQSWHQQMYKQRHYSTFECDCEMAWPPVSALLVDPVVETVAAPKVEDSLCHRSSRL